MKRGLSVVIKPVALLLSGLLFSGCVSRKMEFTSTPKGAEVLVGNKRGATPCVIKVPKGVTYARFSLPSGEEQELPLPGFDSFYDETGEKGRIVVGGTMMGVGLPVAVAGGAVLLVCGGVLYLSDGYIYNWDGKDYSDEFGYTMIGSAGLLAAGAGLYALGHWIYPDDQYPILHADFGLPEEELYEDRGYGAKRMKSVEP